MTTDDLAHLADRARAIGASTDAVDLAPTARSGPGKVETAAAAFEPDKARIGLVLAGGGAKGAYQVGVLQCIADAGIEIAALAGCSIGALNGAAVAAAPDLRTAATRLLALWREISELAGPAVPLSQLSGPPVITDLLRAVADLAARTASPVLDPDFLSGFVRDRIDVAALKRGLPLWVSVFPALMLDPAVAEWGWLIDLARGWTGASAEWLSVTELPPQEVHPAILASAALPPILPSQVVQGKAYRDGGLANVTAAGALVRYGNCDVIIVAHLSRADLWDAHQYPGVPIIEIRPRRPA